MRIRLLIWGAFFLGLAIGRCSDYERRAQNKAVSDTRAARLISEIIKARMATSRCYAMIGDHWSKEHQGVPATPEIASVAKDLAESYRKEK